MLRPMNAAQKRYAAALAEWETLTAEMSDEETRRIAEEKMAAQQELWKWGREMIAKTGKTCADTEMVFDRARRNPIWRLKLSDICMKLRIY
jgi:hypothetical protein